jgi:hypothetical protein
MPRQRVNYHVRALEHEGLVRFVEDRRKGNCVERVVQTTAERYLLDPGILGNLGSGRAPARPKLSFSPDALADSAALTLRELARNAASGSGSAPSLAVEAVIHLGGAEQEREFAKAARDALASLVERYHDPSAGEGRTFRITLGGHVSQVTPTRTRT